MAQFANIPVLEFLLSSEKGRRKSKVITRHFSKVQEQHLHPKTKKSRCHLGDDFGDNFDQDFTITYCWWLNSPVPTTVWMYETS